MRSLFSFAASVPLARVIGEHRAWVVPLALVLAVNVGILVFVVLPLTQAVRSSEARAVEAVQGRQTAALALKNAEALRDGQSRASDDLGRFYQEVLPADVSAARRITNLKLSQMARTHDVTFQRSSASPESTRGSHLIRLKVTYEFSGDYDDIRQLIYDIETAADFIVIDNMALSEGQEPNAPLTLALELSTYYRVTPNGR
jgi:Tfp pilus assembly protein PilO